jgi:hypothetical protein
VLDAAKVVGTRRGRRGKNADVREGLIAMMWMRVVNALLQSEGAHRVGSKVRTRWAASCWAP